MPRRRSPPAAPACRGRRRSVGSALDAAFELLDLEGESALVLDLLGARQVVFLDLGEGRFAAPADTPQARVERIAEVAAGVPPALRSPLLPPEAADGP